jgi:hypothetical protein
MIKWPRIDEFPRVAVFGVVARLTVTLLFLMIIIRGVWVLFSEDVPDLVSLLMARGVQVENALAIVESIRQQPVQDTKLIDIFETALATDGISLNPLNSGSMEPDSFVEDQLARIKDILARVEETKISQDIEVRSFADRASSVIAQGQVEVAESLSLAAEFRSRLLVESGARVVDGQVIIPPSWFRENLTRVWVPQLSKAGILDEEEGFLFYKDAHRQLLNAFSQVEEEGLLGRITQWCGAYSDRTVAQTSIPSVHALGIAFDVNCRELSFGRFVDLRQDHELGRIVQIFRQNGFIWGGDFSRPDPMHFQVYRIVR